MSRNAFSLIELLVVIAIIGILLAVMAPTVGKMHERVNADVCASNLHQLNLAHLAFAGEHQGNFATPGGWVRSTGNWPHDWHDVAGQLVTRGDLFPYAHRASIYLCPTFLQVYRPPGCGCSNITPIFSYAMNYNLGSPETTSGWCQQGLTKVIHVSEPSNMLLMTEENSWLISGRSSYPINNGLFVPPARDIMGTYHFPPSGQVNEGGANTMFVDGHVAIHHWWEGPQLCRQ
ncbi:MAG: hypothetical protein BWX88_02081 [Planctomycetes bacterium ADurb.Bin126]|nr:MAG: hypothetical protein BWX88_02081 [Planctomycetes bacterium ADurb.Bin126]HOD81871.1 prepilin-type N-terminal cleavage/methylation domain-containing protein [Phycisphaerae bacterium]HQL75768.1 prepilin-type N-terminal cleavage/methylation domain-containing protein [Phycisphaerae bacterium]